MEKVDRGYPPLSQTIAPPGIMEYSRSNAVAAKLSRLLKLWERRISPPTSICNGRCFTYKRGVLTGKHHRFSEAMIGPYGI